jgi:hypothetical protein
MLEREVPGSPISREHSRLLKGSSKVQGLSRKQTAEAEDETFAPERTAKEEGAYPSNIFSLICMILAFVLTVMILYAFSL